jgi:uncharacterized protein DUF1990
MRDRLLGNIDYAAALEGLRGRPVNYDPAEVRPPQWRFDVHRHPIARERTGPPEPGGPWELACALVRDYEFTPPELIRAVYHRRDPLLGRDLLLEARFYGLRFYLGVRITEITDELRASERVWGWSYQSLQRHFERGKVNYTVVKHLGTGQVEFIAYCHSQLDPTLGSIMRLGWLLFGRRTQLRFYRRCGEQLQRLVQASLTGDRDAPARQEPLEINDLVLVPTGAEPHLLERFTIRRPDPAR